jgi:hypothetical protein
VVVLLPPQAASTIREAAKAITGDGWNLLTIVPRSLIKKGGLSTLLGIIWRIAS